MLTIERLRELIAYCPETGDFTWKVERRGGRNNAFVFALAGALAGFVTHGYRVIVVEQNRINAHRIAFALMNGAFLPRHMDVDHINGIRDDNRWCNLRSATRSQNMQNLKGAHTDNSTGFLGVERKRDKFSAQICINGKKKSLGSFHTPEEAHSAYLCEKRKIHEMGAL